MIDPHLTNKINSIDSVEELEGFMRAFHERGEEFPPEHRADVLRKQQQLERRRSRNAGSKQ